MTETVDVVVAGAGHNALIAAAYLARAGFECLVLDARSVIGGDTSTEELTLPGFRHDTCSTAHNLIQSSPTLRDDELRLGDYGLEYIEPDPVVHVAFPDGTSLTQWHDQARTEEEFAKFSGRDADAYRRLLTDYDQIKGVVNADRYTPIGFGPTLEERLGKRADGNRWRRRLAMSAWEVIKGRFEDEHTRAFLLWMAFQTVQPVDRPGTGGLAFSLIFGRQQRSWTLPRGGSGALPTALSRVIEEHGGTLLTDKRVTSFVLEGDRCAGVETEDGERYLARKAVLSAIHLKHLPALAPDEAWGDEFLEGVETWQPGTSMFVTHYATKEPPRFDGEGGSIESVAAGLPHSVDRMLRTSSEHRRGIVAEDDPVLLVVCPTIADPGRAPERKHTLKVIGFQPFELADGQGSWDEIRERVSKRNLEHLRRYAPNLTDETILATLIKSPVDLEALNPHNWHGSCHGGDMNPAQSGALRPVPGFASHRLPIAGLYQTGSTTHPGASVSGGPGRNAALVMLQDLGSSLEEAVRGGRVHARAR